MTNQNKFVRAPVQYQIPILFKVHNEFQIKLFLLALTGRSHLSFQIATAIGPSAHHVCCKRLFKNLAEFVIESLLILDHD